MKKSLLFALAFTAISVTVLTSCRKGPDDPFISFRSRDARITGEWKLAKYERSDIDKGSSLSNNRTYTYNFDGTLMTETFSGKYYNGGYRDTTWTKTYSYSHTLTVNKNGTYKSTRIKNGNSDESEGNWFWLDGYKNKIEFMADDEYHLDRLSNKEMIASNSYHSKYYYYDNDIDWSETTVSEKYTFEKK
ncbi:MAG: hypothetical protein HY958_11030 [Bacteroidia bacterium]|nr:hypothetical protein [Bacteroidia bacterium]